MQYTPNVRFWLRRMLKIHAISFLIFLGVYFVFAFLDPGLLSYDMRQKFHALADETVIITATVLGPPVQPVVTAIVNCNQTNGTLSVDLDWGDDVNTSTYDINRDGAPLVNGLANSLYSDTNVVVATTYQYEVTGNGPMGPGFATSLPISVTTPTECTITAAAPVVTIVSFAGRNVDAYNGTPRVSNRRPIFSGTTSMPNATILVTIGNSFMATLSANSNGYWEWKPPFGVSSGAHTFTVIATDPNDSGRQATATLHFDILKRDDDEGSKKDKTGGGKTTADISRSGIPLDFTLSAEAEVLQGESLHTKISISALKEKYSHITVPIRYSVMDEDGGLIFSKIHETVLTNGANIFQSFPIPLYMAQGKYSISAEILLDALNISRTASFLVRELPFIRLSSGGAISYADIIRQLGWIVFFLLFLLLLWLFLFIREFILYLQGDGEVTEYDLKRAGYFRR